MKTLITLGGIVIFLLVAACSADNDDVALEDDPLHCPYRTVLDPDNTPLFPFGECVGDEINFDRKVKISLKVPIMFYGQEKTTLWASEKGVVTFDETDRLKIPGSLKDARAKKQAFIAPYWSDTDIKTKVGGQMYYRQSTQGDDIKTATKMVTDALGLEFSAKLVAVVTWYDMGKKHRAAAGGFVTEGRNTFQLVLVADAKITVGFYNYQALNWTQAFSGLEYPCIGSDSGSSEYLYLSYSFNQKDATELVDVTNVHYRERDANVPMRGVWLQEYYLLKSKNNVVFQCLQTGQCCVSDGFVYERDYLCNLYKVTRYADDRKLFQQSSLVQDSRECRPGFYFDFSETVCRCERQAKVKCDDSRKPEDRADEGKTEL